MKKMNDYYLGVPVERGRFIVGNRIVFSIILPAKED